MENNIHNDIERVLFTSEQLMKRAEEIGKQITEDYKGEEVTIIGILKGSFMFLSDVSSGLQRILPPISMVSTSYSLRIFLTAVRRLSL